MPFVFFETFGCQMNVADSDLLAASLASRGYEKTDASGVADLIVINTCSVREHAETRALSHISQHAAHKRHGKTGQSLWVIGCMAERMGESLKQKIPGIDRIIGARNFETFLLELDEHLEASGALGMSHASIPDVSRFVPIMRGCDNYCAYCVVPQVRGPEKSIEAAAIENTVRSYVDKGVSEVTLLGQNVNSYRDETTDFAALLLRLHDISGLRRIRFTTSHPKDCSEPLVRTIAELPKVCRHVHLPVQSGSTRILSRMNRKYTRDDYLRLIEMIRKHMPDADITTDAMVGFPSEREEDFQDTLSLFRQVRFTTAFMFIYSKRGSTAAAAMNDDVTALDKKGRLRELIDCQTAITKEIYGEMIGTTMSVLFTMRQDGGDGLWMGQDNGCKRVLVACEKSLAGMILPIRAEKSSGMTIVGKRE